MTAKPDKNPPPLVKGWCPGALRPMQSGDGLIVRIRPPLGRLLPEQAQAIAKTARQFGNGLIDLTRRANLQIRGVTQAGWPDLLDALRLFDLLDATAEAEARRNIILDPTCHPLGPAWRLATGLERLAALPLPAKFGVGVGLQGLAVDMTLLPHRQGWALYANGGTRHAVLPADQAAKAAFDLAKWFLDEGGVKGGRGRMANLLKNHALPQWMGRENQGPDPHSLVPAPLIGPMENGWAVALPFGVIESDQLACLGRQPLRLTPTRGLVIEGATAPPALPGLILDADDPLLRIHACTGAPACPQGLGDARTLARRLARDLAPGETLHVSGCAKGCAHDRPASRTLTATPQGWAEVINGRAGDPPDRILPPDMRRATGL